MDKPENHINELALLLPALTRYVLASAQGREFTSPADPLVATAERVEVIRKALLIPKPIFIHTSFNRCEPKVLKLNNLNFDVPLMQVNAIADVEVFSWAFLEDLHELARCEVYGDNKYWLVHFNYRKVNVTRKIQEVFWTQYIAEFPTQNCRLFTVTDPNTWTSVNFHQCLRDDADSQWEAWITDPEEFSYLAQVHLDGWLARCKSGLLLFEPSGTAEIALTSAKSKQSSNLFPQWNDRQQTAVSLAFEWLKTPSKHNGPIRDQPRALKWLLENGPCTHADWGIGADLDWSDDARDAARKTAQRINARAKRCGEKWEILPENNQLVTIEMIVP